ncbi:MAG: DUF2110 family protein [Candidatus Njordarchaeota archaeon]
MIVDIFCPIYIKINENDLKRALKYYVRGLLRDIDITSIEVIHIDNRYARVEINGKEERIAAIFLRKFLGTKIKLDQIIAGQEYSGKLIDINVNYLSVDIGEEKAEKVKIPTRNFISTIIGPKLEGKNLELIMRLIGIRRFFPLVTKIEEIQTRNGIVVYGSIGRRTINLYRNWFQDRLDRVLVFGTLRSHIDKILRQTGIYKEVIRVERLGFLEYAIVCKFGRFADEIAEKLSKNGLEKISIFMPRRIKKIVRKIKEK